MHPPCHYSNLSVVGECTQTQLELQSNLTAGGGGGYMTAYCTESGQPWCILSRKRLPSTAAVHGELFDVQELIHSQQISC